MLTIFRKLFCIIIILIFAGSNEVFSESSHNCVTKKFNSSSLFEEKKIELIDIGVKDYRGWQVNNIRILTNNSHVISDNFKKKFKADIKIYFSDNSECSYQARIRTQGDLKDHIIYEDGQVYQSLDIGLEDGHVNNITKFKLFLKGTRGVEEDEIFMTELLRELGFLAPRTEIIDVKINGQKLRMLFQEKISKELLEYNKRREGPILEGDEKYMMNFISKVKNNPRVDWTEIFRLSDLGTKIQLSKQTNSSWSIKNDTFTKIGLDAIKKLNFIYLVYLNSYQDKKNNYSFLHYNLDNTLLAQNNSENLEKLNIYNNLLIAANGEHGLYAHNRKFYWNSIENYFEPIYYDGEFNLKKKTKNLHYPLSLDYEKSIDSTINLINSLDKRKLLLNIKSRDLVMDAKRLNLKIDYLLNNLISIKKIFKEKNKDELSYNLTSYKNKELFNNYVKNLEKQNVKYKFVKYKHDKRRNKSYIQVCEKDLNNCDKNIDLDLRMKRDLIEGKLKIKDYNYQLIDSENNKLEKYKKIILNDINFKDVSFIYNKGIQYKYDKINKEFNIYQTDINGRSFFFKGEIKDVNINFNGKENQYPTQIIKYDHNNLTGCVSFIKNKFDETSLSAIYANCEDGINMINVSGFVQNIDVTYSVLDGVDLDFSEVFIKNIKVKDSGNDCIDFSGGKYRITSFDLINCGDKGISIGEKSVIHIENIKINKATIGVASKDSSQVTIDTSEIYNTNDCLAAYRKKQEFDGGFLNIKNSDCKEFKKVFFVDQFSKINIENEL
tara:strand:+ start:3623 stop:5953 length:2331 start_codon:yes stop_codon:yes gene_type:complete